ncbi:MAG: PQQ-binding-like beta-propeller repeat protein [Verrucomicrobiaceae bacterium]|nr:PQQ-binding-like beta-propeller repeat protein [Verrucomicrobiaceae bacterium]
MSLVGKITSEPDFNEDGGWITGGSAAISIEGVKASSLPSQQITVEADVVIEKGQQWGGIISYAQDNGDYERGWLLGYNESAFVFWISTGGSLKEVVSDMPFTPGVRYKVTGSFDGKNIRIYVDGRVSGAASIDGNIVYPKWAYYAIGAYKDENENYPMLGRLFSASVFSKALTEDQVRARSGLKPAPKPIEFTARPVLRFTGKAEAQIQWSTALGSDCAVVYGIGKSLDRMIAAKGDKGDHVVTLGDLRHAESYSYRIVQTLGNEERVSPEYEFNTSLNFNVLRGGEGGAQGVVSQAAAIVERAGINRGYCLVIGATKPELLLGLSSVTEMSVVALESDQDTLSASRKYLYENGVYGSRVSIIKVDGINDKIPLTSCMVNLLVSLKRKDDDEIRRVLVPGRGKAMFLSEGGRIVTRDKLKDSGEWTHQYGNAGNTASSNDSLGGATGTADFAVQWVGRPGADFGIDRNPRMPAPIVAGGRLFHQGMNRLIALDSNNGAVLWAAEIPDLRRVNIPRDCGNWCADDHNLYVAVKDQAFIFNAETGRRRQVLKVLPEEMSSKGHDWGYIGRVGNALLGTTVRRATGYTSFWSKRMWFDGKGANDGTAQVCSDSLFSYELVNSRAKPSWVYRQGVILNPTISAMSGRIYFVETRNKKILASTKRRLSGADLWRDQFLVALDARSGKLIWEQAIDTQDGTVSFYLQASPEGLLLTASNTKFHLYAFDPETGMPTWKKSANWPDDHHSGHFQHPVITGGNIYLQPNGYRMNSGELITSKVGRREGCHTYVGAGGALIYRGKSRQISMWDRKTESVSSWPRLRPSCWLNTIPASGMLLVPEGGGGCSCGGWMETSIGFLPKSRLGGAR